MLCMAALLACFSSAVLGTAMAPSWEAAADRALAEALAYFGAGPGLGTDAGWQLARLEAALEGAGFHRRRRYEVVLQRGGACDCRDTSASGHDPAWLEHAGAVPGRECCSGASLPSSGPAPERVGWAAAAAGGERGREGAACEAAVLQALPAGVFADPYELAGLEALAGPGRAGLGRAARARVFGPVDLEALEPHASPTVMALWGPVETYPEPAGPCPASHARADGVGTCSSERLAAADPEGVVEGCEGGRCSGGYAGERAGDGAADQRHHVSHAGQSSGSSGRSRAGSCGNSAYGPGGPGAACAAPGNCSARHQAPCSGAVMVGLRLQAPLHARYTAPRLPADGTGWASFSGEPATYMLPPPLVLARCQSPDLVDTAAEGHASSICRDAAWTGDECGSEGGGSGLAAVRGACGPPAGLRRGRWEVVRALDGAGAAEARWRVPTGNPAHEGFVSLVTAAAFLLAAAAMVRVAFAGSWR